MIAFSLFAGDVALGRGDEMSQLRSARGKARRLRLDSVRHVPFGDLLGHQRAALGS